MDTKTLKEDFDSGKDIMVIDIREKEEYKEGDRIEESINIPMNQILIDAAQGKLPKDKKIVIVCKLGRRSEIVMRELSKAGYNVEHLEGGVEAWKLIK